ncbi:hypothetical protein HWQ46_04385 [Shewanella sp. D64]|uniref:hypothetical protein n=1 Tax=unclassified Shewanella TaxID=196818 RepID=UPI0022BA363D|nr:MULTISPECIES: hypothetical protein [unclassified Shewanella]MEC4724785.1 hypothetical protein [Shewanella sp. D64]MEC4736421.1 hypothetical protein [Shewanella sp. E94]WBJ97520.1 hypothetical protein HWQ47_10760 [Shewanella sp. MTB7]
MNRIKEAQEHLKNEYKLYNDSTTNKLPELELESPERLDAILESVTRRESLSHAKKIPPATKLKSALADTLLLLDNFDIKKAKEAGKAETS